MDRDKSLDGRTLEEESETGSERENQQSGVKRIEAIATTWTSTSLIVAYVGCVPTEDISAGVDTD